MTAVTTSPARHRRVALATGLTYHVVEWGPADGECVVLVHGFLDLAWTWAPVAARLADRYRVIAPDLRGHGDSDWIGGGGYYHFLDYAADLDDLVGRLGPAPVNLVGHSMGGSVSAYWAGTRPDRVRRLALIEGQGPPDQSGATASLPDRTARWFDAWRAARARAPKVMASADDAIARLRKHDPLLAEADARELVAHGTLEVDGGVSWKHDPLHLTMGPYPFRVDVAEAYWRRITCPVLVVDGAASTLRLPDAERDRRAAVLSEVRTITIPGAGHAVQRHQPVALADALRAHLA